MAGRFIQKKVNTFVFDLLPKRKILIENQIGSIVLSKDFTFLSKNVFVKQL